METLAGADPIKVSGFVALTLGIVVYFLGARLTQKFPLLSAYSIPEPVSGGLSGGIRRIIDRRFFGTGD